MSVQRSVGASCNNCGSPNMEESRVFGEESIAACPACGVTAREGDLQMQDELTKMFQHSMQLDQRTVQTSEPQPSISQHYHHSAHQLVPIATTEANGVLSDSEAIEILARHGIEAVHLSFSQAALFKKADGAQRDRLIELWRISPPQPSDWQASGGPGETSVDMEERLARQRYESNRGQAHADGGMAEPYIKTVYDGPAKTTYSPYGSSVGGLKLQAEQMSSAEWWRDYMSNQPMELQYGMLRYMNNYQPAIATIAGDDAEMH